MKKVLFIFSLFLTVASFAQTRTYTAANIQQGQFSTLPAVGYDSLAVTDSFAYIIPVTHLNVNDVFHTFNWTKVGSGTATLTVNYFQSNDNVNFFAVTKGSAQSAYTKSFTLSATGSNYVSFAQDSAVLTGRYLKIQMFTNGTASVKGYLTQIAKTDIR
jgi:hypothetical protein